MAGLLSASLHAIAHVQGGGHLLMPLLLRFAAQFGLFHGDPHPGNIFALRDGRIAYVDFGNVAEVSQQNKQTLIDAVVHAVNEDYEEMAKDFIKLVWALGPSFLPLMTAVQVHAWVPCTWGRIFKRVLCRTKE
jgi:hypothetical protein